jgi:1-deoxy-D-xylulose-5-phosphate reductoisomerase
VKRIAILGSTGSIGQSALAVVDAHADRLRVVGLAAGENVGLLADQIARYRPSIAAMASTAALDRLRPLVPPGVTLGGTGREGLVAVASHPDVDLVLCASAGTDGLEAVVAAIEHGKTVALANKEVLVMAGRLVTEAASRRGVTILPVDSEHNAIHQCLHGRPPSEIARLVLTASGGPFRGRSASDLSKVSAEDALKHPTWQMGRKITIDSATLMNKGLEVIEARWLFGVGPDQIDVVIHPQSVVHSMVELTDGSLIAQMGVTDMRLPIQYAFSYPERWRAPLPRLDLARAGRLDFEVPDTEAFPCLRLAYRALGAGGSAPLVLNAANEIAVARFLEGRVAFSMIPQVIERTLDAHTPAEAETLEAVRALDRWARDHARAIADEVELQARPSASREVPSDSEGGGGRGGGAPRELKSVD